MIIERYGESNIKEFIAYLYSSKLYTDNKKSLDTFNMDDMEDKSKEKKTLESIRHSVSLLSPLRSVDTLSQFEYENVVWIFVMILCENLDEIPLYINSNFKLVRETAMWRLKINK